ncbi:M56 family peptidase, partial [Streptomyces morookaense]|nr:M56 family peptidase [Streptomyces morookaense]
LTATAGPVPRRVAALLAAPAATRAIPAGRTARAIAFLLAACLLASGAAAADATNDLHDNIESAQHAGPPSP